MGMGAKHRWTLPAVAGGILLFLLAVAAAYAQTGIFFVEDAAFDKHRRPPVPFHHDEHNETAGITECNTCHHMYEDGEKLEFEASIGMECSQCHLKNETASRMDLIRAYHLQCRGCHLKAGAGPITCSQCHRGKTGSAAATPQDN